MNEPIPKIAEPTEDELRSEAMRLGHEAMMLLDSFPCSESICDGSAEWREKREKLLECWRMNAMNLRVRKLSAGSAAKEVELRLISNPFKAHYVRSISDMMSIPEIELETRDREGWDFVELVLDKDNMLCATHASVSTAGERCLKRLAMLGEAPPWIKSLKS